jgi:hypothetical protein
MRLPVPAVIRPGTNALKVRKTPSRSVARHSRQAARSISCSGAVGPPTPALATTVCTGPSRSSTDSAINRIDASAVTSHASATAVPSRDSISATVSAQVAGSRAVTATA